MELNEIIKSSFPLLKEKELLSEIVEHGKLVVIPANEVILKKDAYIKELPLIVHGAIKVLRENEEGHELLMYYLAHGETCSMSLTCCLQEKQSQVIAIAEEDSELIMIPVEKVDSWLHKYPSWLNFIMLSYQQRFNELLETIDNIAFTKLDQRLLNYLKERVEATGKRVIYTTHNEIALELNSSREAISRLLKKLEKEGVVQLARSSINVLKLM